MIRVIGLKELLYWNSDDSYQENRSYILLSINDCIIYSHWGFDLLNETFLLKSKNTRLNILILGKSQCLCMKVCYT